MLLVSFRARLPYTSPLASQMAVSVTFPADDRVLNFRTITNPSSVRREYLGNLWRMSNRFFSVPSVRCRDTRQAHIFSGFKNKRLDTLFRISKPRSDFMSLFDTSIITENLISTSLTAVELLQYLLVFCKTIIIIKKQNQKAVTITGKVKAFAFSSIIQPVITEVTIIKHYLYYSVALL